MSDKPKRVQLSRQRGWRMPDNTVSVARPGRWGNPFRILNEEGSPIIEGTDGRCYEAPGYDGLTWSNVARQAVDLFRLRAVDGLCEISSLRGKNLACWCKLCDAHKQGKPFGVECPNCLPCHSDVLGELANPVDACGGNHA